MTSYRKFKKPPIIAIGGTKGKTTIARLLSYLYTKNNHYTLLVDTDGHYVNNKIKSTIQDSLELYGLVPTNYPGRYLYELKNKSNSIAILETAVSCYRLGLGYNQHKYVIFTNLLKDHIGLRIKNRRELARKKTEYLFGSITPTGKFIANEFDTIIVYDKLDDIRKEYKSIRFNIHRKKGDTSKIIFDAIKKEQKKKSTNSSNNL